MAAKLSLQIILNIIQYASTCDDIRNILCISKKVKDACLTNNVILKTWCRHLLPDTVRLIETKLKYINALIDHVNTNAKLVELVNKYGEKPTQTPIDHVYCNYKWLLGRILYHDSVSKMTIWKSFVNSMWSAGTKYDYIVNDSATIIGKKISERRHGYIIYILADELQIGEFNNNTFQGIVVQYSFINFQYPKYMYSFIMKSDIDYNNFVYDYDFYVGYYPRNRVYYRGWTEDGYQKWNRCPRAHQEFGTYIWDDGVTYYGRWDGFQKHGFGEITWTDLSTNADDWNNDIPSRLDMFIDDKVTEYINNRKCIKTITIIKGCILFYCRDCEIYICQRCKNTCHNNCNVARPGWDHRRNCKCTC